MDIHSASELMGQLNNVDGNNVLADVANVKVQSPHVAIAVPVAPSVPVLQKMNQIPKNLSGSVAKGKGGVRRPEVPAVAVAAVAAADYYSIFGFQLSKTTVYIIIAFVVVIGIYYLYKYFASSKEKGPRFKRKPVVSFRQQRIDDEGEPKLGQKKHGGLSKLAAIKEANESAGEIDNEVATNDDQEPDENNDSNKANSGSAGKSDDDDDVAAAEE
ncbi:MAG: hypothetical protein Hyperionvirus8_42 [Hyperionvirus sp.]|uniref:Uncharacterized protein n=1 Tax=Hyperionvirus sp. TaxID=2487770 RepID=A0A3G5A8I8_9VIRU|nr:MAG: hypothetical protein Hyperionvirus8_42 [Hyperionvirus sp.]